MKQPLFPAVLRIESWVLRPPGECSVADLQLYPFKPICLRMPELPRLALNSTLLLQPSPQLATYTIITSITSLLLYSSLFRAPHYWQELSRHQVVTQTVRILHFIGCISELTVYCSPESHFIVTCPKQPCFVACSGIRLTLAAPAHLVPFLAIHLLLC